MKRSGITLVEVMVVTAILVVLLAIGVSVSAPIREKGRQTVCAAQILQMHSATMMYTADNDNVEDFPGLGPLADILRAGGSTALRPYVKNEEIGICPDLPSPLKSWVPISYRWWPVPPTHEPTSPGEAGMMSGQAKQIAKFGRNVPLWICDIHDEVYYQPRDAEIHDMFMQPFVIEISVSGKIFSGRRPYLRSNHIEAWEAWKRQAK